jgi:gas vesicle protein
MEAAMADNGNSAIDRLTYLLIGAGIGATIALLFAPKSGKELRGDIADATRKGIDYTKESAARVGERAGELYSAAAHRATEIYDQTASKAQELIESGKGQIAAKRGQISAAIEAGKEAYAEEKGEVAAARSEGEAGA